VSDTQLRQDVIDEFAFDPRFDGAHIGVAVDGGVVSLSGHVESYAEKMAVIAAARRVKGVHSIAESIEIRYVPDPAHSDDQIARRAAGILKWDSAIRPDTLDVVVHNGWVTLSGEVDWYYERVAAEEDVRKLAGVRGVTNEITIRPRVAETDIKSSIEAALRRRAETEAEAIRVSVHNGNKVTLEGDVGSLNERIAVETAAWSVPGVTAVDDRLGIRRRK